MQMRLDTAFDHATDERTTPEQWLLAERTIVECGFCPNCAQDGERVRLGRHHKPSHETHGGGYCPTCETFVVCGPQESGTEAAPDYGGAESVHGIVSDADPGL